MNRLISYLSGITLIMTLFWKYSSDADTETLTLSNNLIVSAFFSLFCKQGILTSNVYLLLSIGANPLIIMI